MLRLRAQFLGRQGRRRPSYLSLSFFTCRTPGKRWDCSNPRGKVAWRPLWVLQKKKTMKRKEKKSRQPPRLNKSGWRSISNWICGSGLGGAGGLIKKYKRRSRRMARTLNGIYERAWPALPVSYPGSRRLQAAGWIDPGDAANWSRSDQAIRRPWRPIDPSILLPSAEARWPWTPAKQCRPRRSCEWQTRQWRWTVNKDWAKSYWKGLIRMMVTPVSLSPFMTACMMGVAPRHLGSRLPCTLSIPLMNRKLLKCTFNSVLLNAQHGKGIDDPLRYKATKWGHNSEIPVLRFLSIPLFLGQGPDWERQGVLSCISCHKAGFWLRGSNHHRQLLYHHTFQPANRIYIYQYTKLSFK